MRNLVYAGNVILVLLAIGASSGARAQQPASAGPATPTNGWIFNVAPYLWFPTVNVSLNYNLPAPLSGRLPTDVSVGPGDILGRIDYGVMLAADARNGRFSIFTDYMGARFSATTGNVNIKSFEPTGQPSVSISRALETSTGSTLNMHIWTLAGGYTVLQGDWGNLDVIAGMRLAAVNARTDYNLALTLAGPRGTDATFGGIGSVTASRTVVDGIGGVRGRIHIANTPLFVPYYFDIGAGGSQLTWQIASGLGYQFNNWGAASITYRYLSFHKGSDTLETLSLNGPVLMMSFTF